MPERIVDAVTSWFARNGRDLPWRRDDCSPWGVMVSEFMLQQTPVSRVVVPWTTWLERWPTPLALAQAPVSDAIRAWGRLGYPRRALRLHASAEAIVDRFGGQVPDTYDELRSLPGVGDYTAAAIASFAFGRRELVLDTNVRRVLARIAGESGPPAHATRTERERAAAYLPDEAALAAVWAVASMELGALICRARTPLCEACPIADECGWRAAGYPGESIRRVQDYEGTDRQCRGNMLRVLRDADEPVAIEALLAACTDREQARRCLDSLYADGLAVRRDDGITLP